MSPDSLKCTVITILDKVAFYVIIFFFKFVHKLLPIYVRLYFVFIMRYRLPLAKLDTSRANKEGNKNKVVTSKLTIKTNRT